MAAQQRTLLAPRPKRKTPAERAVEFDALQARLKAEAAERRRAAPAAPTGRRRRAR